MVSMKSLLALALVVVPVAKAEADRVGEDWVFFDDYIKWVHEKIQQTGEDDWNQDSAIHERGMGTFWNMQKMSGRPEKMFRNDNLKDGGCAVHFYYPDMLKRADQRKRGEEMATSYARPLAMAPYCSEKKIPNVFPDKDFPGRKADDKKNDSRRSVVFHNLHVEDQADDCVFVLSGQETIANADLEYVKADDFVSPSIVWAGEDEDKQRVWDAFDYPRVTRDRDGKEVFDYLKILDWIKTWLEKEHGGNIPNPYRFGVGNPIWANYTGINDFWGYDENGHYADFPKAA